MLAEMGTVRDRTFEVMRRHGMTRIFGNPGSTEIPFLTDLPRDFDFVLALHEGSVVGIASGYALATGAPAFVNLHTAPGLGNAGNAIAGARDSRAPLVIVVGQQDRAQSAMSPFLTGRDLDRLAGTYPVWATTPARPQALPGGTGTVALAERLGCPVWQEAFSDRAGFPQDHPLWAGHLPWQRSRMRATLAPHDLVIVLGAGVLRLYIYEPGPFLEPGTQVAVVSDDPAQLHRSAATLAVLAAPGPLAAAAAA